MQIQVIPFTAMNVLLPSTEEESKNFTKEIYACCFRQRGEDKKLFPAPADTNDCLQLKIILMLKWFLWG